MRFATQPYAYQHTNSTQLAFPGVVPSSNASTSEHEGEPHKSEDNVEVRARGESPSEMTCQEERSSRV